MSKDKPCCMGKLRLKVLLPDLRAKCVLEDSELKSFLNGRSWRLTVHVTTCEGKSWATVAPMGYLKKTWNSWLRISGRWHFNIQHTQFDQPNPHYLKSSLLMGLKLPHTPSPWWVRHLLPEWQANISCERWDIFWVQSRWRGCSQNE